MTIEEAMTTLTEKSFFLPKSVQPALTTAIRSLGAWNDLTKELKHQEDEINSEEDDTIAVNWLLCLGLVQRFVSQHIAEIEDDG